MFWSGKNKQRNVIQDHQGVSYEWLDRLTEALKVFVRGFCNKMEKRFNKIDRVFQKVILIVFFLSGTTLCVFFAVGGGVKNISLQKVTPITRPAHTLPYYDTTESLLIRKKEGSFQNIHQYKILLDSLSATVKGKQVLDSLRSSRPGLLDSLALINRIMELH
ncbi:hypothetical protein CLV59_105229 [Chitinophaga dinghuensis]|uniref:Uncharacterized protein n=1 Tax=Chitinophaga dinghuensis TaxID=1539050 RepID=A0A327VXA8_9BACT|nr:hypothetical protein [Chitinophaga dinghuensis]RAJ80122.1 hypothetical protein CLV59_105229 [Chitinophaga dinghuensis]